MIRISEQFGSSNLMSGEIKLGELEFKAEDFNDMTMNGIEIRSDIPAPITGYLNWKKISDLMKLGDSVHVNSEAERNNLRMAGNKSKKKFISRRERDGWRIWRIE